LACWEGFGFVAPRNHTSPSEHFRNVALGLAGVISSILIPLLGFYFTGRDKQREVSKDFVEIAIKILSDNPTKENKPLRQWAISLINSYSTIQLTRDATNSLLTDQPIFTAPAGTGNISPDALQKLQDSGFVLGVDLSHFDSPDFSLLKQRGVKFAFIKASQGPSFVDAKAAAFAAAAKQNGILVGLYHYFTGDPTDAQFANFERQLTSIPWDLPPVIDCEVPLVPTDYASRVIQFATQLSSRFGVKPIIHTGALANAHLDQRASDYPLWVAQYVTGQPRQQPTLPRWWTSYAFWQVGTGVSGDPVLGAYDIDVFKGTATDLAALQHR
jgi:GH25 family lysozyme M1 (1,4-beta-N-acetylmuramidase)